MIAEKQVVSSYETAKGRYADLGVDVEKALSVLETISISLQCWQGDDVGGFENPDGELSGGIATTGNYPGKARNAVELRQDLDFAYRLLPGKHRLSLHAIYAETNGKRVERNELRPEHFANWKDWAKAKGIGVDFNPTCFSHPLASDGFTLSHADPAIRQYWIEHCIASREIGAYFGRELGTACVNNLWIPDGYKDSPVDRMAPRKRLYDALKVVLAKPYSPEVLLDAVEPKLFGIGSESYVVGSMEFYEAYAVQNGILLTLDSGHFHPTEIISDKLSSLLIYMDQLLLHVSRGVRWDSDHVVTYTDDLQAIAQELVRHQALGRVHIGLDYFDASINRVAAWAIGTRNTQKALLAALLEPLDKMMEAEKAGDYSLRLAMIEENKWLPMAAVWDYFCLTHDVPVGLDFMAAIKAYEADELVKRG